MQNVRSGHAFFKQSSLLLSALRSSHPGPIRLTSQTPTLLMPRKLTQRLRQAPSGGACWLTGR